MIEAGGLFFFLLTPERQVPDWQVRGSCEH